MRGWRAWHWDGERRTVYSSAETAWQSLPEGIVGVAGIVGVVVYQEPPYRMILQGHDWVWLEDGALLSLTTADEWGEWVDPPEVECRSCVKRGAPVPDEPWARIQREMQEARVWP